MTDNPASKALNTAMLMAAHHIHEEISFLEPRHDTWARDLDCGVVRVRIRVEVEPTGLTLDQALAAAIAADENETPEVRAAARLVAAGGPDAEEAVGLLAQSGPWPFH
ncbi:hypothetical protein [Streptomyces sp. HGB0020]|jgi:hypothetical protein|uniref:hypothetical protein n=1 Tax=Streptomyces sp. HGB0020 TaxID=1078086 RepID=UPI00034E5AA1|nr:hypothetical protein [Streptomyces sp. HGB0020]EPD62399.1 hypothetical protein HMPREF1211_04033 [Streptomyces sp. HGB0020]